MVSEIAERYAQGLFETAEEDHTIASKRSQAEALLSYMETSDDLTLFLEAVKITLKEKKELIDTVFDNRFDENMIHFLKLVVDKDRVYYLKEMLRAFIDLCDENLGIQKAEVYSARALPQEELDRIKVALEKKTGKKILLKNPVDPSLLAGIKVVVGNNVTDVTMKSRIENMRETLLKGGQAG